MTLTSEVSTTPSTNADSAEALKVKLTAEESLLAAQMRDRLIHDFGTIIEGELKRKKVEEVGYEVAKNIERQLRLRFKGRNLVEVIAEMRRRVSASVEDTAIHGKPAAQRETLANRTERETPYQRKNS